MRACTPTFLTLPRWMSCVALCMFGLQSGSTSRRVLDTKPLSMSAYDDFRSRGEAYVLALASEAEVQEQMSRQIRLGRMQNTSESIQGYLLGVWDGFQFGVDFAIDEAEHIKQNQEHIINEAETIKRRRLQSSSQYGAVPGVNAGPSMACAGHPMKGTGKGVEGAGQESTVHREQTRPKSKPS